MQTMEVLTPVMVRELLDGVQLGTLSRDGLENALSAWKFPIEEGDRDEDLRGYLVDLLRN